MSLEIFSDYMENVPPVEENKVCSVDRSGGERGVTEEGVTEGKENLLYIAIGILVLLLMM